MFDNQTSITIITLSILRLASIPCMGPSLAHPTFSIILINIHKTCLPSSARSLARCCSGHHPTHTTSSMSFTVSHLTIPSQCATCRENVSYFHALLFHRHACPTTCSLTLLCPLIFKHHRILITFYNAHPSPPYPYPYPSLP